jgi:hypothetical protein
MKMQEIQQLYNMPDTLTNIIPVKDSLLKNSDSLKVNVEVKKEGIPFQPSFTHNNWIFGLLLLFFILSVYGINRSFSWLTDAIANLFKVRTRSSIFSKSTLTDFPSKLLLIAVSSGVISLYIYLHLNGSGVFQLNDYLFCFLAGILFLVFKNILMNLTGFVFLEHDLFKNGKEQTLILFTFTGLLIFPLTVLRIYLSTRTNAIIFDEIALLIWIFMLIFITFKLFQIFFHKILDFFYIMLYLCTLEILPAIGLYQAYKLIIIEL